VTADADSDKPQKPTEADAALLAVHQATVRAGRAALSALVNLSQDPGAAAALIDLSAVPRTAAALRDHSSSSSAKSSDPEVARLLVMLLANLTTDERGAEQLLQPQQGGGTAADETDDPPPPQTTSLFAASLLRLFMVSSLTAGSFEPTQDRELMARARAAASKAAAQAAADAQDDTASDNDNDKSSTIDEQRRLRAGRAASEAAQRVLNEGASAADPYEHVAAVLLNLTRLQQGRGVLLARGGGFLQAMASQLRARSLARRRGASGALRNCCLSAESDGTLPLILEDEAVLRLMIGPLSGGLSEEEREEAQRRAQEEVEKRRRMQAIEEEEGQPDESSDDLAGDGQVEREQQAEEERGEEAAAAANEQQRQQLSSSETTTATTTKPTTDNKDDPKRNRTRRPPAHLDDQLREHLAEAVAALAAADSGREALRRAGAVDALARGYEWEEHPGVCAAMEMAARCFVFDDGRVTVEEEEEEAVVAAA
jgi:hypothetical protein